MSSLPDEYGKLLVEIKGATDLPGLSSGPSDPYCVVTISAIGYPDQRWKTTARVATRSPVWEESKEFVINDFDLCNVKIVVRAKHAEQDEQIGAVTIELPKHLEVDRSSDSMVLPFQESIGKRKGKLSFQLTYISTAPKIGEFCSRLFTLQSLQDGIVAECTPESFLEKLQNDIDAVISWANKNHLRIKIRSVSCYQEQANPICIVWYEYTELKRENPLPTTGTVLTAAERQERQEAIITREKETENKFPPLYLHSRVFLSRINTVIGGLQRSFNDDAVTQLSTELWGECNRWFDETGIEPISIAMIHKLSTLFVVVWYLLPWPQSHSDSEESIRRSLSEYVKRLSELADSEL